MRKSDHAMLRWQVLTEQASEPEKTLGRGSQTDSDLARDETRTARN